MKKPIRQLGFFIKKQDPQKGVGISHQSPAQPIWVIGLIRPLRIKQFYFFTICLIFFFKTKYSLWKLD
ncbi:MAG: hypothetical protein CSA29_04465 [Desulfobacterales bacterium]|nr:MAG: hypothetical protein CSA29_04465 [Desulfobacterales bacterium]